MYSPRSADGPIEPQRAGYEVPAESCARADWVQVIVSAALATATASGTTVRRGMRVSRRYVERGSECDRQTYSRFHHTGTKSVTRVKTAGGDSRTWLSDVRPGKYPTSVSTLDPISRIELLRKIASVLNS